MKHHARKRFGQNFLVDQQVVERLVAAIRPRSSDLIIEIGPGRQALTAPLAASGAQLVVIELDRDLAARLAKADQGFRVLNEDALKVDYAALAGAQPYRLVGNLPYNISTPLLFHVLDQHPPAVDMHFMLQKEVVDRMAASPGEGSYGRLSLTCQNFCAVTPLFEIGPEAFDPRPKVTSTFVRLAPRASPRVEPGLQSRFELLVSRAFSMRRKTLRNSLHGLLEADAITQAGIDPGLRPEALSIDDFISLARIHTGD